MANVYQMVTDRITAQLEQGNIPWRKPWTGASVDNGGAINYVSRRPYSLINQLVLGRPGEYLTWKQIEELGGDETRSELDEVVRDWMLREHPEERKFMDDFSETVTFRELAERMEAGEDFYDILDSTESQQREYVFARLADITDKDYDHWYYTWLSHGDKAKYDEYIAKRKAVIKAARRKRKSK